MPRYYSEPIAGQPAAGREYLFQKENKIVEKQNRK
jgi:hypothetical protein